MSAAPPKVVFFWRAFLPYHRARLAAVIAQEQSLGVEVLGLQAVEAPTDYEFLNDDESLRSERIAACFPESSLADISARQLFDRAFEILEKIHPIVVFCPAAAFPEGMAAINWRARHGGRVYIMDDAWELTDRSGALKRIIKRIIHKGVDGAFAPAEEYKTYWRDYGVPPERVLTKVHVVDNDAFARPAEWPRFPRFLFVGRDLPRKGLRVALAAYARYRQSTDSPWEFHIVGPHDPAAYQAEGVRLRGALHGRKLHEEFWSASAFIMPSDFEQWGLVVNEAMAASLPVIASRGVGAARSLIEDEFTGWTFDAQDAARLASLMISVSRLSADEMRKVTFAARKKITAEYSLDAFIDSVRRGLAMPRRAEPGLLTAIVRRSWTGKIKNY